MNTTRQLANEIVTELIAAGAVILSRREQAIDLVEKVLSERDGEEKVSEAAQ